MTPSDPMVEKVARAIERAWSQNHASIRFDPDIAWKVWTPEAEAAIKVLNDRLLCETQMLAFKWMEAHDKLKAGLPYDFPNPANLPEALALNAELVEALTAFADAHSEWLETECDTPEEVNACAKMGRANDKARALLHQDRGRSAMIQWKPDAPRDQISEMLRTRGCPYWREPDGDNAKLWLEAAFRLIPRGTK